MKYMLWHVVTAGMAGVVLGGYVVWQLAKSEINVLTKDCEHLHKIMLRLMDREPV